MTRRIVILSGREETPLLRLWLAGAAGRDPETVGDLGALEAAIRGREAETRVIAFLTDVIIPAELLARLGPEPYNIHGGPPEFRGAHADSFAIYQQSDMFGVTAHVLAPELDAGEIIMARRFPIPPGAERTTFAETVLAHAIEVFAVIALAASATDAALARSGDAWSGPLRTKAGFHALRQPPPGAGADEIALRARASGPDFIPADAAI